MTTNKIKQQFYQDTGLEFDIDNKIIMREYVKWLQEKAFDDTLLAYIDDLEYMVMDLSERLKYEKERRDQIEKEFNNRIKYDCYQRKALIL